MFPNNNQGFFNPQMWRSGPTPGQFYNFPGGNAVNTANNSGNGKQHTSSPITVGTSVVGIKFDGGVLISADNLVSYGSLARYQDVQRVFVINQKTVIGAGGDFADFQSLKLTLDQKILEDTWHDNDTQMKPRALYNWLTRVLYNRRSRVSPLWVDVIVGGVDDDGRPFLGHVDMRGRAYEDDVVVTGFGKHLALPLVREKMVEGQLLSYDDAVMVMRKCMEVLYYRDCRAMPIYSMVVARQDDAILRRDLRVDQNWDVASMVAGY